MEKKRKTRGWNRLVSALCVVALVATIVSAVAVGTDMSDVPAQTPHPSDAGTATSTYRPAPTEIPLEDIVGGTPLPEPSPEPAPEPVGASESLPDEVRDIVERVVMAESGNQDFDGQALVAQCILNTAEARDMTPDAVVLEKNQYAAPVAAERVSESVKDAVRAVFDEGYQVTTEQVRFFYAPKYSTGATHESRYRFVLEHGDHRFFAVA